MNDVQTLAGFIGRERPGARLLEDVVLPEGGKVNVLAVEDGRLAGYFEWEEGKSVRRLLNLLELAFLYLNEVWLVSSLAGIAEVKDRLPIAVGQRILQSGTTQLGTAFPATVLMPKVKDIVMLLTGEECRSIGANLGVSDHPLSIAAAGQLSMGTFVFRSRLTEVLGLRCRPASAAETAQDLVDDDVVEMGGGWTPLASA